MKVDLHTHILPPSWPDLKALSGYGGWINLEHTGPGCARMLIDGKLFREVEANCFDPQVRLAECDRHGVTLQVLSTVPVMFSYWAQPRHTLELARVLNDHLAEVVRRWPARFAGLGTLPMQDADLACRELERCVGELGLRGVEVGTNVNGKNLDHPDLFPVFERAWQLGAAVFVHPWEVLGKERLSSHWLAWLVGMPAETCAAICSVLMGGLLDRLPGLRLCFAHGGGSFPGTIGRIEHGYHVRPDLCATTSSHSPRSRLREIYVDSLVHDPDTLCTLLRLFGPERVALGTDYPFPLGEQEPGKLIESLPELAEEDRRKLLAETALEFLGMRGA